MTEHKVGLLRPFESKSTLETPSRHSVLPQGTIAAWVAGMDEHQDDLEPEVQEGDEFETETYVPESSEGDITDEPEHEPESDHPGEPDDKNPDEI